MSDIPFKLDPFQVQAIQALDQGLSVLVCAPTGTGKTVIADHMVARALAAGEEVVYTAPIKALSSQKFRDYTRLHGPDRVGLVTGDQVIRRDAPCRVMTTEILRNILLNGDPLGKIRHVILDEIHFLDDPERGTTWEEVLIYLPPHVQILGLSATLSNLEEFARWLESVRGAAPAVILETHRAVPLKLHLLNRRIGLAAPEDFDKAHKLWRKKNPEASKSQGRRQRSRGRPAPRNTEEEPRTTHVDVFERLPASYRPYLYFVFSRQHAEQYASQMLRLRPHLLDPGDLYQAREILDAYQEELGTRVLRPRLRELYEQGVAFHHAGLHVRLKALVEELYERKLIRILYCTSTFALGINMPARSVVFDALKKFDGHEVMPLTTRQFMQKAGRSGRRGMDEVGHVVVRMDYDDYDEARPFLSQYREGRPERVKSSFNLSFNSVVSLLERHPIERLQELVQCSFLAFHHRELAEEETLKACRMEEQLRDDLHLAPDADWPDPRGLPPYARKRIKDIERIRHASGERVERCWKDFEQRVDYLRSAGYLARDLTFNAGANVVRRIQINEILVAEFFLAGLLDELDPATLFGLLCACVQELGRNVTVLDRMSEDLQILARQANRIRHGPVVAGAEALISIPIQWCPDLIPFGVMWARGRSLADVMSMVDARTDISGDLVGAFRRARDLMGQVIDLYGHDRARQEALKAVLRSTARDEVEVVD